MLYKQTQSTIFKIYKSTTRKNFVIKILINKRTELVALHFVITYTA